MTSDLAGSVPPSPNHRPEASSEHRSTVAGIVLSAVVTALHTAGDHITDAILDDVVAGVLAITEYGTYSRAELDEVVNRLVLAELLERRGTALVLGRLGKPAIAVGGLG